MKYLYLRLNGYKRLALNSIDHFSITITEPLQLILGSNGSGKSSLVSELTPLPAFHGDFTKTGSKLIKIEHNHEIFTLASSFAPKQCHSFLKGDMELNEGGTVTIQKELVKFYFGITAEIHELILGRESFESMSASRRKEWFIKLCVTNYDYAIKVYNKFKEKHRDATGALRLAKKRLVSESEKLIQTDEEMRLRNETQILHTHLSHLLEHRKPVEKDVDTLQLYQGQVDEALYKLAKTLNGLTHAHLGSAHLSAEVLGTRIAHAETQSVKAKALIEQFSADHRRNQTKIDALQKAEAQTITSLGESAQALQGEIAQRSARLLTRPLLSASTAMSAFQTVKTTLLEVFTTIPSNQGKLYGQEALQKCREAQNAAQAQKKNVIEQLQAKQVRLKHMQDHKDHPDLTCPSCAHRFSLNYNDADYAKLVSAIAALEERLSAKLNPQLAEYDAYVTNCVQYAQLYRQYASCLASWPVLQPYWDYLTDKRVITDAPQSGIHELSAIDADLLVQLDVQALQAQLAEKEGLLALLKDVGGADLNTLLQTNQALSEHISAQTDLLQSAVQAKKQATEAQQRASDIASVASKITGFIQKKRALNKEEIETLRRLELNGAIRQLQSALASREHTLSNLALQRGVVDNIALQIFELEQDEAALGLLVKQLSPTEGLIAEGLLGFIKNFVGEMNGLIKKVWSYPLVIQTCEVMDDVSVDLDYKFPMTVMTRDNVVSDVSKGSAGMKEIVNLAFRLIAMRYLNLQDSPLVLDEFSASFDTAHRAQAVSLIKALIEQQTFSQVFMISHYESSYGALSNAQVCVLSDINITVPKSNTAVNAHVLMR